MKETENFSPQNIMSTLRGAEGSKEGRILPTSPVLSARAAKNWDEVNIEGVDSSNVMRRSKQYPKRMNKFIEAFSGGNLLAIAALEQSSFDGDRERATQDNDYVTSHQNLGRPMTTGTGKRFITSNTGGSSSILSPNSAAYLRNS